MVGCSCGTIQCGAVRCGAVSDCARAVRHQAMLVLLASDWRKDGVGAEIPKFKTDCAHKASRRLRLVVNATVAFRSSATTRHPLACAVQPGAFVLLSWRQFWQPSLNPSAHPQRRSSTDTNAGWTGA